MTCGDSGDVHTIDGQWRGECTACDAAEILRMRRTIKRQAAEIERLKAAQSMSPASATHGEIALRWRVQDDGLYAVDMMVSNLDTEEEAHAAMAYIQSLFAGDEMAGEQ